MFYYHNFDITYFFLHYKLTLFTNIRIYNRFEMIVYVDIIFVENIILDFIILFTVKIICGGKTKILRILIGSIIGSTFSVIDMVVGFNNVIYNFVISLIIILISFGFRNQKYFIKRLGVFYLTSVTFGGSSLLFIKQIKLINILFCGTLVGFFLIVFVQKLLVKKLEKTCKIEIDYKGESIEIIALIDSRKFIDRKV